MCQEAIIIGAGIGGLACAAAMAQSGISVRLYEQATALGEVGAGLQISPNGLAVLRALGISDMLYDSGAVQAQTVLLADYKHGAQVARLDLRLLDDQRYLFMHRADLIDVLAHAAREAGVQMTFGARVQAIKDRTVYFHDGKQDQSDVIVGADGLRSVVREALNGADDPFFTGQVAWRALVETPAGMEAPTATVTMGPGRHIVSYPIRGGALTNIVAVQERGTWAAEGWAHADDPRNLRDAFSMFSGPARELIERVEDVNIWGLFRHPVAQNWHRDGAVLIGDAAHPTLPFMAQGANLALEDAWTLAQAVNHGEINKYQGLREGRTRRIVDVASKNAWRYHLNEGPVRWAAHLGLTAASRFAPVKMMRSFDWIYAHDVTRPVP